MSPETATKPKPVEMPVTATEISNDERIIREGLAAPSVCHPWRIRPIVPPEVVAEAYLHSGIRDGITLWEFGRGVNSGQELFCTSETGWLVVQDIKRGASASIHGGCWKDRRGTDVHMHAPTHALLDWFYELWGLQVLLSAYPEHNRLAAVWDRQFGFVRTGVIPFADFWGGTARNLILTARFKKVTT